MVRSRSVYETFQEKAVTQRKNSRTLGLYPEKDFTHPRSET